MAPSKPTLPSDAAELPALLGEPASQVASGLSRAVDPVALAGLAGALATIEAQASLGAALALSQADPEASWLPELLGVRAWLLAVAAGARRLSAPLGTVVPVERITRPGADRLRSRYQHDLAAADRDHVLGLLDDLLDMP